MPRPLRTKSGPRACSRLFARTFVADGCIAQVLMQQPWLELARTGRRSLLDQAKGQRQTEGSEGCVSWGEGGRKANLVAWVSPPHRGGRDDETCKSIPENGSEDGPYRRGGHHGSPWLWLDWPVIGMKQRLTDTFGATLLQDPDLEYGQSVSLSDCQPVAVVMIGNSDGRGTGDGRARDRVDRCSTPQACVGNRVVLLESTRQQRARPASRDILQGPMPRCVPLIRPHREARERCRELLSCTVPRPTVWAGLVAR
ncbi:hypothetical protein F4780DRAFT_760357 [Xylariomycetidae sp. FL0641]|nr:hypothetical protein F4780DRAFT_760357 [Xylariomycetidae sp. FL0641]